MAESLSRPEVEPGWDVRDVDGELVGTVIEVAPSYVLVEQGRFFPDDVYLPLDVIGEVTPGVVSLSVTGQAALNAGWHAGPPAGVGAFSTAYMAPGIMLGGQIEELGTSTEDVVTGTAANQDPDLFPATTFRATDVVITEAAPSEAGYDEVARSTPAPPRAASNATRGSVFQPPEIAYLEQQVIGRLATVDATGQPHVVPVTYRYNRVAQAIDISGPGFATSKKYQDIIENERVAFVVDDLDPNQVPRGIEIRGRGELLTEGGRALDPRFDDALLRIHAAHIALWGLDDGIDGTRR